MSEPSPSRRRAGPLPGEPRDAFRARMLEKLPRSYNPWLHLGATVGSGLVVLIVALWNMPRPDARAWLTIPITFLLANGFEWRAHKDVLHRRFPLAPFIYDRHTPEHHVIFTHDDMALRSARELYLVIMPPFAVPLIVAVTAPFAWMASHWLGAAAGWTFLATCGLYVVFYELSHTSYHLPPDSTIGRWWLVRVLREHHRIHHDPRLMRRWNFNVTIPLFDWVHRTIAPRDLVDRPAPSEAVAPQQHPA